MVYTADPLSSSPRVRDKQFRVVHVRVGPGIIPAGAGQTSSVAILIAPPPDHPRGCGANHESRYTRVAQWGSSPRVRGKPHPLPAPVGPLLDRIIPAGAGQTTRARSPEPSPWDHPRGCGANLSSRGAAKPLSGSSPRVRGKRIAMTPSPRCRRIIPAGAGQTALAATRESSMADHPRGCGANQQRAHYALPGQGSSPRVRGKRSGGGIG